jgi:hypothetical protein
MGAKHFLRYKYFDVGKYPLLPGRKTHEYPIANRKQGSMLGVIKWYGAWRQFCFFPEPYSDLVFTSGCLQDIRNAIEAITADRKAEIALKKS